MPSPVVAIADHPLVALAGPIVTARIGLPPPSPHPHRDPDLGARPPSQVGYGAGPGGAFR